MEKIVFDFEGEKVEIFSALARIIEVGQIGTKVPHNGEMYHIVERVLNGIDEVAAEFATWDGKSPRPNHLALTFRLEKV